MVFLHVLLLIFGSGVPYARARKMLPALETIAAILYPEAKGASPIVDFGKAESLRMLTQALKAALKHKATNADFAFISRAEMGLYSLLHQLNARVNVRETWQKCDS